MKSNRLNARRRIKGEYRGIPVFIIFAFLLYLQVFGLGTVIEFIIKLSTGSDFLKEIGILIGYGVVLAIILNMYFTVLSAYRDIDSQIEATV